MNDTNNSQNIKISKSDKVTIGNISHNVSDESLRISGNISHSNLNIKSPLSSSSQIIGSSKRFDDTEITNLNDLIKQLENALGTIPEHRQQDAEAVATLTHSLVEQASVDKPNNSLLKITSEGLKQAAKTLEDIMPSVVKIAGQIIATLLSF